MEPLKLKRAMPAGGAALKHGAQHEVQHEAERVIRDLLNRSNGWNLKDEKLALGENLVVEVDGIDRDARVLVEITARIGKRSSTRDDKVVADAAKLMMVAEKLEGTHKLVFAGCDEEFLARFRVATSTKWHAHALRFLGVEVMGVEIPIGLRERLQEAQRRQALGNVHTLSKDDL